MKENLPLGICKMALSSAAVFPFSLREAAVRAIIPSGSTAGLPSSFSFLWALKASALS